MSDYDNMNEQGLIDELLAVVAPIDFVWTNAKRSEVRDIVSALRCNVIREASVGTCRVELGHLYRNRPEPDICDGDYDLIPKETS